MNIIPDLTELTLWAITNYWPYIYVFIGSLFSLSKIGVAFGDAALAWFIAWPILLPISLTKSLIWFIQDIIKELS